MAQHGCNTFQLIGARPIGKNDISPVVILRNKTNQLSGWRLNKTQYDFVTSLYVYEVDLERK